MKKTLYLFILTIVLSFSSVATAQMGMAEVTAYIQNHDSRISTAETDIDNLTDGTTSITGVQTFNAGYFSTSQTVYPTNAVVADTNVITAGITSVNVGNSTYDADDFIVLPAITSVPVGFEITIVANGDENIEVRTPASSGEEINSEDCDGTKEYLLTDGNILTLIKISDTIDWVGYEYTPIGAVVTAVVPD